MTGLGPLGTSEGGILGYEEDEAQPHRCIPVPGMPTKAEMAEHRASGHIPYCSLCSDCVEAFGQEWPHSVDNEGRVLPLVSCDYLYVTPSGVFARDELSEEERDGALRVLIAYCGATKSLFAHAIPHKGAD